MRLIATVSCSILVVIRFMFCEASISSCSSSSSSVASISAHHKTRIHHSKSSSSLSLSSPFDNTATTSSAVETVTGIPRGGSLYDTSDSSSSSSSFVMKKLRNVIRSFIEIAENKSPVVSKILKSVLKGIEKSVGVELLPKPAASKKKKKKQKKTEAETETESDESETVTQTKAKSSSKTKKDKTSPPTSSSTTTKKNKNKNPHLQKELKATNPNYRIQRELKAFLSSPPPNLRVQVGKSNIRVWIIHLTGAKNTIYEGEKYKLKVTFPPNYPTVPPSMYFLQPTPRHEHVYTNGDICLSLLGKDWRPTMTAQSVANSILSILSGAQSKGLPMDNSRHAGNKPGQAQDDWVYHDDNC